ncbi:MAG: hypothetical protein AAFW73_21860 [Bacteroidota bacterium]
MRTHIQQLITRGQTKQALAALLEELERKKDRTAVEYVMGLRSTLTRIDREKILALISPADYERALTDINLKILRLTHGSKAAAAALGEKAFLRVQGPRFQLYWVLAHVLGYSLVSAFSNIQSLRHQGQQAGILLSSLLILLALLGLGFRLLRPLTLRTQPIGLAVNILFSLFISYYLVTSTGQLSGAAALSGAATTLGTSIIASRAGGWLIGSLAALVSAVGALVAASLLPWLQVTLGSILWLSPVQLILLLGTASWAFLLARALLWIVSARERLWQLTHWRS